MSTEPTPDFFGHAFQFKAKERLLRDPLHGLIPIDESTPEGRLFTGLIDSPEFQRLRRIRQLGMAHVAFQGAEHSRFTHSVGAFHLIGRILDQLMRGYAIDSELAFYARIAALVHDLGHGPFSHVFERFTGAHHEAWTLRILHDDRTQVHRVLSDWAPQLPSYVESMLNGMAKPGYLCSLVSSQLDVDRLDYLLRDSLMTGVKYGVYDIDRLMHMLRIAPGGDKIVVAAGGLVPVEKYIQARYHMYQQVYLHKTVTAAEAMLMSLLRRAADLLHHGNDAGLDTASPLARILVDPGGVDLLDYLDLDDVTLWAQIKRWARGGDPILADLADRILTRRLFKTIEVDAADPAAPKKIEAAREAVRTAGLDPDYYLLEVESGDTPYKPYDLAAPKASDHIFIEAGGGRIVDVAQVSPTIEAFTHSAYRLSRLVFPAQAGRFDLRARLEEIYAT